MPYWTGFTWTIMFLPMFIIPGMCVRREGPTEPDDKPQKPLRNSSTGFPGILSNFLS
jgi:hypothetical protein